MIREEPADGRQQSYRIVLNADQYLKVIVEQRGLDVGILLSGPDGKQIREFDADKRGQGQEVVWQVAEVTGEYRLTVRPQPVQPLPQNARAGGYEIRIEELRAATETDRELQKARALSEEARRADQAGKYDEELRLSEQALAIYEQRLTPEHPDLANSLNHLATVHFQRGNYAKAEPLFQRALAILERSLGSEHPSIARALNNAGLLYYDKGDYAKAQLMFQRSLAIIEKALGPEHPDTTFPRHGLAILHLSQGDYSMAEQLAQRNLTIEEKASGPENPSLGHSLSALAAIYFQRGDYAKAEPLYQRARAIWEKAFGPEHPDVVRMLNNLALIYDFNGGEAKAEPLYQRVIALKEKVLGREHPNVATTLGNLAEFYSRKGDYLKAEPLLQRALAIREQALGPEHSSVATSLNSLAFLYHDLGDDTRAESLLRRALAIQEKALGPEHPNVGLYLHNLAFILHSRSDQAKAEPLYQRALAVMEKAEGPEHFRVALCLNHLGRLYLDRGDVTKAEPLLRRALAIREQAPGPEQLFLVESFINLATLCAVKGDFAEAIRFQSRANAIGERNLEINLAVGSERQKLAYLSLFSRETDFTLSLHTRVAPRDPQALDLAFTTWLRRKGRGLEAMANTIASLRRHAAPEDQELFDRLAEARSQLAAFMLRESSAAEPEAYRAQRTALKEKIEELETALSNHSAEFRTQSRPVTVADVQSALPANSALVEFAVYEPQELPTRQSRPARYVAYLLTPQAGSRWVDLGEAEAIDRAVEAWRGALRDPRRTDVKQLAQAVDEKILRPVRALLASGPGKPGEIRRLLISPDGSLNLIPFAALVDEQGSYLIERYSINYLVSGRDLIRLQISQPCNPEEIVMADPDYGRTKVAIASKRRGLGLPPGLPPTAGSAVNLSQIYFPRLRGTADEARALKAALPMATVLTRGEATEEKLKRVSRPRILHLATHGFFLRDQELGPAEGRGGALLRDISSGRPVALTGDELETPLLRSGLALAGANQQGAGPNGEDGVLTGLEAAGLDLWGTKLVVLSACDTGVGEVKNGEGVYGLRRALVLAGSETQVMSLWPVSDLGTRDLMTGYYRALERGEGRGEGLRRVQLEMLKRRDRRHPFYWASFIQSGEWANLDGKR
ncbi:MAG TPA: tetratricopeptide repeat protein [Blastocatellia bacterium]|nr:tetratricopeptide repeat protein [Blastocatellia bacterium]